MCCTGEGVGRLPAVADGDGNDDDEYFCHNRSFMSIHGCYVLDSLVGMLDVWTGK